MYPPSVESSNLRVGFLSMFHARILMKVLANCLNQIILSRIHPDQIGFMPRKNAAMNSCCLYMNIHYECLRGFGFSPKFIKWGTISAFLCSGTSRSKC